MSIFQKISESTGLVTGMAERLGVDMQARMAQPDPAARSLRDMVTRCASCPEHAACTRLQEDNPALDAAPAYCRNADVFARGQARR